MTNKKFISLFKTMPLTGFCEIYIGKTISIWDETIFISQWKDEYRLCCTSGGKCTISKQQAKELIIELDLNVEQSTIFNSGKTWRK